MDSTGGSWLVVRIGYVGRTFHVAFTSLLSAAKVVLVAPVLGQLQIRVRPREVIAKIRFMALDAREHSAGRRSGDTSICPRGGLSGVRVPASY
jgi:hypothetical protein